MIVPCWKLVATPQCQYGWKICIYWDEGWRSRVPWPLRWRLTHPMTSGLPARRGLRVCDGGPSAVRGWSWVSRCAVPGSSCKLP